MSPLGDDVHSLWTALHQGSTQFVSGPDRDLNGGTPLAAEAKGVRYWSRESRAAVHCASRAWNQAAIREQTETCRIGVYLGTMFAGQSAFTEIFSSGMSGGSLAINPCLAPEAGFNGPASRVAMMLAAEGPNITVSAGLASALYALDWAKTDIECGRCDYAVAGGVDSFCGVEMSNSVTAAEPQKYRVGGPVDTPQNGFDYSEGTAIFVLESEQHALARRASILGLLSGSSVAFHAGDLDGLDRSMAACIEQVLQATQTVVGGIDLIVASASGHEALDRLEVLSWRHASLGDKPVCRVKAAVGENLGAGAGMQVACGILALNHDAIPKTGGFDGQNRNLRVSNIEPGADKRTPTRVLITSGDESGFIAAAVLECVSAHSAVFNGS